MCLRWPTWGRLLVLLLLLSCPGLARAQCSLVPATIQTVFPNPDPLIDHSQSSAWLWTKGHENQQEWQKNPSLAKYTHTMGLTLSQGFHDLSLQTQTAMIDGQMCVQLKFAHLEFGYTANIVFIASEIPDGSCRYQDVFHHEQRHVAVNRAALAMVSREFSLTLSDLQRRGISVVAATPEDGQNQILEYFKTLFNIYHAQLEKIENAGNSQIDTPAEYDRSSRACNGDVPGVPEGATPG